MSVAAMLLMLALGLALTVWGGDWFVDASVWLAEALGLPKFLVGATVVSLATTLPELAVSLLAAGDGASGIAAGNAVGSVTANLGLILGLCLCLAPGKASSAGQGGRLLAMLGAGALLYALCAGGRLTPAGALPPLALGIAYLVQSARDARRLSRAESGRRAKPGPAAALAGGVKLVAGGAGIAAGARLLSGYGAALALGLGVPEGVIGATLVAVGTSLPELVTALTALRRGHAALSVGNVVGANIIDLTLILPLCVLTRGGSLPLPRQSLALDLPFCLMLSLAAVAPALLRERFTRAQGAALLAGYEAYLAALVRGGMAR